MLPDVLCFSHTILIQLVVYGERAAVDLDVVSTQVSHCSAISATDSECLIGLPLGAIRKRFSD